MVHPIQPVARYYGLSGDETCAYRGIGHRRLRRHFSGRQQNQRLPADHLLDAASRSYGISNSDDTTWELYWERLQRSGSFWKLRFCRMADIEVFPQKPAD